MNFTTPDASPTTAVHDGDEVCAFGVTDTTFTCRLTPLVSGLILSTEIKFGFFTVTSVLPEPFPPPLPLRLGSFGTTQLPCCLADETRAINNSCVCLEYSGHLSSSSPDCAMLDIFSTSKVCCGLAGSDSLLLTSVEMVKALSDTFPSIVLNSTESSLPQMTKSSIRSDFFSDVTSTHCRHECENEQSNMAVRSLENFKVAITRVGTPSLVSPMKLHETASG
mmetsp:Transcript_2595/g.6639  ORF Transcript_2595/g.6639 Transcript_2595/m.6639 type:complete len:222 (-) Transcript_2595:675-1340(-)